MSEKVKMFDYWAFYNDGSAQFFQICNGEIFDYRQYADVKDAPVMFIDERAWSPDFVGPINGLRYHGRSYVLQRTRWKRE